MALVFSEMDRAKIFERSVSSFSAEIQPHFMLTLIE